MTKPSITVSMLQELINNYDELLPVFIEIDNKEYSIDDVFFVMNDASGTNARIIIETWETEKKTEPGEII